MRIAVVGAGLSGCTIARLLKDRGHDITIFEKEKRIGGLCATATHRGRPYQLFGPHNFHTHNESVIKFLCRFSAFNNYVHRVGTFVDGKVLPYPISYKTIDILEERDYILKELAHLPKKVNMANFESCVVSMVGKTLYKKFIENYTLKFWRISPKKMGAEWAPEKIEIRRDDSLGYFGDEWQGLPTQGYTHMFEKIIEGIPIHYDVEIKDYRDLRHDLVISTIPIDELFSFCYGRLAYRGLDFVIHFKETEWEDVKYGCINFPERDVAYTRKSNYSLCYYNGPLSSYIVGYEFPGNASRMYPIYTSQNKKLFNKYLTHLIMVKNLISVGRLGLFRYYDMDKTVEWCLDNIDMVENYPSLTPAERIQWLSL
ncbi:MAG: NAD(P)-binding protein [Candidatus Omnitrophica bacterium]|nr:NAD(P)-binding protein [Candidatus Omnitrophota bacterium]